MYKFALIYLLPTLVVAWIHKHQDRHRHRPPSRLPTRTATLTDHHKCHMDMADDGDKYTTKDASDSSSSSTCSAPGTCSTASTASTASGSTLDRSPPYHTTSSPRTSNDGSIRLKAGLARQTAGSDSSDSTHQAQARHTALPWEARLNGAVVHAPAAPLPLPHGTSAALQGMILSSHTRPTAAETTAVEQMPPPTTLAVSHHQHLHPQHQHQQMPLTSLARTSITEQELEAGNPLPGLDPAAGTVHTAIEPRSVLYTTKARRRMLTVKVRRCKLQ